MAAKKASKQTKNFNKKHLTHTLISRKKHQANKKRSQNRQHLQAIKRKNHQDGNKSNHASNPADSESAEEDDDDDSVTETKPKFDMSVDALLNAQGLELGSLDSEDGPSSDSDQNDDGDDDDDDLGSISSLEDESNRKMDFELLKEKDPEFYKFLEENDKGLLDFDANETDSDVVDGDEGLIQEQDDDDATAPKSDSVLLTKELLRTWQKAILEVITVSR